MPLERIAGFDIHPAASHFPLMSEAELDELARDIKERGLDQPVLMFEGKVLDGRNRLMACQKAEVEPRLADWDCRGGSPASFVLSANVRRRHLSESQRAMLAAELLPLFEKEAHARRIATLKKGEKKPESAPVREREKAADRAAAAAAVSTRYVEAAKAVAQKSPELAEKVKAGTVTLKRAEKEIRKNEAVRAVKAYVAPAGRYNVIVADPSWPFDDELDGSDAARGGLPYPPMTLEEICALQLPADNDCVLFLWTTNTHLSNGDAAQVLKRWGFKSKTILTWDKQRMGTGRWLRNITEHCLIAVKGSPTVTLSTQTTLLTEPKREHSRKPEGFYRLVESLCPSPNRIEMFSRTPREGWITDGPEKDKFAEPRWRCQGYEGIEEPCDLTPGTKGRCPSCTTRHAYHLKRQREAPPEDSQAEPPVASNPIVALSLSSFLAGKDVCCGCGADDDAMHPVRGTGKVMGGMKDGRYGLPMCFTCKNAGKERAYVSEADWLAGMAARQEELPLQPVAKKPKERLPRCRGYTRADGVRVRTCSTRVPTNGTGVCTTCTSAQERADEKWAREKGLGKKQDFVAKSLAAYRERKDLCSGCGVDWRHKSIDASKGGCGGVFAGMEGGKGALFLCSRCQKKGIESAYVVTEADYKAHGASPGGLEHFRETAKEQLAEAKSRPADGAFATFPGGDWKLSRTSNPKAHAYLFSDPTAALCGANIGNGGDLPKETDRRCAMCRLKADVLRDANQKDR